MLRLSLRLQITLLWVFVNLAVASLVGFLLCSTSGRLFKENFLAGKLSLAVSLASSIDGDVHARFVSQEVPREVRDLPIYDRQAPRGRQAVLWRGCGYQPNGYGFGGKANTLRSGSRLRSLPIDTLKIDRAFVMGVPGSREDRDLVQTVITIAHGFGQIVCTEGVESIEQLEFLAGIEDRPPGRPAIS